MGKNGAGKTTFFLTILGVLTPTAGRLRLFDHDTTGWAPYRIASSGVACAPQENAFFQDLTVNENLRLGSLALDRQAFQRGRDRVVAMFAFLVSTCCKIDGLSTMGPCSTKAIDSRPRP